MNPIGIAIGFVVLWIIIGMGLYLTCSRIVAINKQQAPLGFIARVFITDGPVQVVTLVLNLVLLAIGLMMILFGGYATYNIIYR